MEDFITVNTRALLWKQKLAYSTGHILNDLCSAMWFTYLLVYLHRVLRISNIYAGAVLLVGQVADALATLLIGLEIDKLSLCGCGPKKSWHLVGTICVLVTFPFIFMNCLGCHNSSQLAQVFYYSGFAVVFHIGWAAVQIAHMALSNDMTEDEHERTDLMAYRNAGTVLSNTIVYAVTWIILGISGNEKDGDQIGPEDLFKFRNITLIILAIGFVKSVIFLAAVNEKRVSHGAYQEAAVIENVGGSNYTSRKLMECCDWFKEISFYQVASVYMLSRVFANLVQVYMPLYLQDTLALRETSVAILPLIMCISGFLSSFVIKPLCKLCGRKITYSIGVVVGVLASIWVYFGQGIAYTSVELYIVAVLYGIATTILIIGSLSITGDLIGPNTESSGFVFGVMSFVDKIADGVAIIIIQVINPCRALSCLEYADFYRFILTFVCGGSCVLSMLIVLTIASGSIGLKRLERQQRLQITAVGEVEPLLE